MMFKIAVGLAAAVLVVGAGLFVQQATSEARSLEEAQAWAQWSMEMPDHPTYEGGDVGDWCEWLNDHPKFVDNYSEQLGRTVTAYEQEVRWHARNNQLNSFLVEYLCYPTSHTAP